MRGQHKSTPQAQASADGSLGREECLEDLAANGVRYTSSIVAKDNPDSAPAAAMGGDTANANCAVRRYSVKAIAEQVRKDLANLSGPSGQLTAGINFTANANVLVPKPSGENHQHTIEQFTDVDL